MAINNKALRAAANATKKAQKTKRKKKKKKRLFRRKQQILFRRKQLRISLQINPIPPRRIKMTEIRI